MCSTIEARGKEKEEGNICYYDICLPEHLLKAYLLQSSWTSSAGSREKKILFSFASVHSPCFCFNKLPSSQHMRFFFPILFSPCPVLLRRGVMEQLGGHMASSQRQPWQLLPHASGRPEIVGVMHLLKMADRQDLFASKWWNSHSFPELSFDITRQNCSDLPLPLGQGICIFSWLLGIHHVELRMMCFSKSGWRQHSNLSVFHLFSDSSCFSILRQWGVFFLPLLPLFFTSISFN